MDESIDADFNEEDWQELTEDFCPNEKEIEKKNSVSNKKRSFRKLSIFTIYARVFRVLLSKWVRTSNFVDEEEHRRELEELILPSNEEWRQQVYFRLVELQRQLDRNPEEKE